MSRPAEPPAPWSAPGQCRDCMMRRNVFSIQRRNGGNYRTAPRLRSSSICAECATGHLLHATPDHGASGWSVSTLCRIVATLDTDRARAAIATYDARKAEYDARRKASEVRMAPYWARVAERKQIIDYVRAQAANPTLDADTCRARAAGIKRGRAGHESTGSSYDTDGNSLWAQTMREQVVTYLLDPDDSDLHDPTCRALAHAITEGAHEPTYSGDSPTEYDPADYSPGAYRAAIAQAAVKDS